MGEPYVTLLFKQGLQREGVGEEIGHLAMMGFVKRGRYVVARPNTRVLHHIHKINTICHYVQLAGTDAAVCSVSLGSLHFTHTKTMVTINTSHGFPHVAQRSKPRTKTYKQTAK